jgi:hypothetical protein
MADHLIGERILSTTPRLPHTEASRLVSNPEASGLKERSSRNEFTSDPKYNIYSGELFLD